MPGARFHSGLTAPSANDAYLSLPSIITRALRLLRRFRLLATLIVLIVILLCLPWKEAQYSREVKNIITHNINGYHPSQPQTELAAISPLPSRTRITWNNGLPKDLKKESPSFHLLVRSSGLDPYPALCRTLFSGMILNYPPPTLVGSTKSAENYIGDIYKYLSGGDGNQVKDNDVVLIVDEDDVWFQLPAEVLLARFESVLKEHNDKLLKEYGPVTGVEWKDEANRKSSQKYSQRIIFGATKLCGSTTNDHIACTVTPPSPLLPDIYGADTDWSSNRALKRPRWLNPGTVIGTLADMRLLYGHADKIASNTSTPTNETEVLGQIFGEQEYVREINRRNTASWSTRLAESLDIFERPDISNTSLTLLPGTRYDYGIGLDYKSQLFFPTTYAETDLEWLHYNDVAALSSIQRKRGVPREARINAPRDVFRLSSPYYPPVTNATLSMKMVPPYNETLDDLPHPFNESWTNIPLATNIYSKSIPAVLRVNTTETDARYFPQLWSRMWYKPWSRGLLRKFMRTTISHSSAASSWLGGEDAWDMRGGKGGIWTSNKRWIEWGEVCGGFEKEVFGDRFGLWGHELDPKKED